MYKLLTIISLLIPQAISNCIICKHKIQRNNTGNVWLPHLLPVGHVLGKNAERICIKYYLHFVDKSMQIFRLHGNEDVGEDSWSAIKCNTVLYRYMQGHGFGSNWSLALLEMHWNQGMTHDLRHVRCWTLSTTTWNLCTYVCSENSQIIYLDRGWRWLHEWLKYLFAGMQFITPE